MHSMNFISILSQLSELKGVRQAPHILHCNELTLKLLSLPIHRLAAKYFQIGIAKALGQMEFEIPKNVLAIVYSQAVCW